MNTANPPKYGRLTIIGEVSPAIYESGGYKVKSRRALCACDCGKQVIAALSNVKSGKTRSCGCLKAETDGKATITHGMSKTPIYAVWCAIKRRCNLKTSEDYPLYGGRGITVCERWAKFENFLADMGARPTSKHTIDRIDSDGDYCPENCRWVTQKQQQNNRRNNRLFSHLGETKNIQQWSDTLGIPQTTMHRYLVYKGLTVAQAIERYSSPSGTVS
jgi:hypothetical protein